MPSFVEGFSLWMLDFLYWLTIKAFMYMFCMGGVFSVELRVSGCFPKYGPSYILPSNVKFRFEILCTLTSTSLSDSLLVGPVNVKWYVHGLDLHVLPGYQLLMLSLFPF